MAEREQMNVRVLAQVKRELEGAATARGVSLNRLIEELCASWLESQAPAPRSNGGRKRPSAPSAKPEPNPTLVKHARAYMARRPGGKLWCGKCGAMADEGHFK